MPYQFYRCRHPGCNELVTESLGYCSQHQAFQVYKEAGQDKRKSSNSRGYTFKWQKARKTYLRRNPLCVSCDEKAEVVDHIIPHGGDSKLFWDTSNWQALCHKCHNTKTMREVQASKGIHSDIRRDK